MVTWTRSWLMVIAGVLALLVQPAGASACAVCFGDPNSDMGKGAAAGVLVMAGVIYGVLMGFVGIIVYWVIRAKRLAAQGPAI
jgi:hypothetical protein